MFGAEEMMPVRVAAAALVIRLVGRDVDAERAQPSGEPVDQRRRAVDELLEARDDRRDDQCEQQETDQENRSKISPVARPRRHPRVTNQLTAGSSANDRNSAITIVVRKLGQLVREPRIAKMRIAAAPTQDHEQPLALPV